MPTPIDPIDKAAFIAVVAPVNTYEADRLVDILNNYEDISLAVSRQIEAFAGNNAYLVTAMSCFSSDADLMAVGIYFNKTAVGSLTDPVLLINCTYTTPGIGISIMNSIDVLQILGRTDVGTVTVTANRTINVLYIGPDVRVNIIDSSPQGAVVYNLFVTAINTVIGKLNRITTDSAIGVFTVSPGAYFGGRSDSNPLDACATPVTALRANDFTTHDSTKLSWTLPAPGYSFVNVFYKESGSNDWLGIVDEDGQWAPDSTSYTFMRLKHDTFYDFMVTITCANGGVAETTVMDIQTNATQ